MRQLETVHAEMHATVKHVVEMKESGDLRGAQKAAGKVGEMSEKIVALLTAIERKVLERQTGVERGAAPASAPTVVPLKVKAKPAGLKAVRAATGTDPAHGAFEEF